MKKVFFFSFIFVIISKNIIAQWQQTTGTAGLSVISIASKDSLSFSGTWGSGIWISNDGGFTWTNSNTGLTNPYVYPIAFADTSIYAGTIGGGIYVSDDSGNSWSPCDNLTDSLIYSFAIKNNQIFAGLNGGQGGVFQEQSGSCVWNNNIPGAGVLTMAVHDTSIYVGTCGLIYISNDDGVSWMPNIVSSYCIWSFAFLGNYIYASTEAGGVIKSTDNGVNWTPVNNGLPTNLSMRGIVSNGNDLFVTTAGSGVFMSADSGITWNAINAGLSSFDVRCIALIGPSLFVGTWGGGSWIRSLSEILSSEGNSISQNRLAVFPNPTQGDFSIKLSSEVKNSSIQIFNQFGEIVFSKNFNGMEKLITKDFPKGIYSVRIIDRDKNYSCKFVVQ